MDQNFNLLSMWGRNCFLKEKKELDNFSLITEIDMNIAKKLAGLSGKLISSLEIYNDATSPKVKLNTLEDIKTAYAALVGFVKNRMKYFEPRKVLIMCENKMILSGIIPAKIAEKIKEEDNEYKESNKNKKNNKTNKVNSAMQGS